MCSPGLLVGMRPARLGRVGFVAATSASQVVWLVHWCDNETRSCFAKELLCYQRTGARAGCATLPRTPRSVSTQAASGFETSAARRLGASYTRQGPFRRSGLTTRSSRRLLSTSCFLCAGLLRSAIGRPGDDEDVVWRWPSPPVCGDEPVGSGAVWYFELAVADFLVGGEAKPELFEVGVVVKAVDSNDAFESKGPAGTAVATAVPDPELESGGRGRQVELGLPVDVVVAAGVDAGQGLASSPWRLLVGAVASAGYGGDAHGVLRPFDLDGDFFADGEVGGAVLVLLGAERQRAEVR